MPPKFFDEDIPSRPIDSINRPVKKCWEDPHPDLSPVVLPPSITGVKVKKVALAPMRELTMEEQKAAQLNSDLDNAKDLFGI